MKFVGLLLTLVLTVSISAKESTKLVWPSPPDPARIELQGVVTKPEDLQIEKGLFTKVWEFFVGSSKESLVKPFGLHVDENRRVYITDVGLRAVIILDPTRNKKLIIDGSKEYKLLSPMDVDTDASGNIFIADSEQGFIHVYDKNGKFLKIIGKKRLHRPVGIAVDSKSNLIYVVDTLKSKIQVYSVDGKYVKTLGKVGAGDGEFNKPTYIALDANDGYLYVSDSMNHRVQVIDKNGKFINKFGQLGNTMGSFANPRGITIDKEGHIFVTDTTFHAVQIFNKKGQLLLAFGSYGDHKGEFAIPEDIVISNDGTIYVADSYNMRVQVFKLLEVKTK